MAVALASNSTFHIVRGLLPFFLLHERKVVLLVQKYLDEPRLDSEFRAWLSRLWKAPVAVFEKPAVHAKECKEWPTSFDSLLPVGAMLSVRLNPQDKAN